MKLYKSLAAAGLITAGTFTLMGSTLAFGAFGEGQRGGERTQGEYSQHMRGNHGGHQAIKDAIKNADYDSFLTAVEGTPMAEHITSQDEFNKLVSMHEARESGDYETAKTLAEELGLPDHKRHGKRGNRNNENKEAIKDAVENSDYAAFLEAVKEDDSKLAETIDTQEKFDLFVDMHEARENGDYDTAKEIAEELGLPNHNPNNKWNKKKVRRVVGFETYESFQELYGDTPIGQRVTEEIFNLMQEMIEAYQEGDRDTVQSLKQQIKDLLIQSA